MGIVIKQSLTNTIITFIGFALGAFNALYAYPLFLGDFHYGLTAFVLSTANLLMPFMAFGVQNTLIRFYSNFGSTNDQSAFLNLMLLLPLLIILPFFSVFYFFYEPISLLISQKNPDIFLHAWMIPIIALFMAYFEIFYAWTKVHLKSVSGNFLKEVLLRALITITLILVTTGKISGDEFMYSLLILYGLVTFVMALIAFQIRRPVFHTSLLKDKKEIFVYTLFIVFSSGVAIVLLDIDKFMIAQYVPIEQTAYYSVAIFMAISISVPMRAMHQITHPLTTSLMSNDKWNEVQELYQKSSISLQAISGLIFVCILVNLNEIYSILPQGYATGFWVVYIIGFAKYADATLGTNNSIVFNSPYYKIVVALGVALVIIMVLLNRWLIPILGLEGAALATLVSVLFYNGSKLFFVTRKMKLSPFRRVNLISFLVFIGVFLSVNFISFPLPAIVSILIKASLCTILYTSLHYYTSIVPEFNVLINKYLNKK